jgi:hypothetical protein
MKSKRSMREKAFVLEQLEAIHEQEPPRWKTIQVFMGKNQEKIVRKIARKMKPIAGLSIQFLARVIRTGGSTEMGYLFREVPHL